MMFFCNIRRNRILFTVKHALAWAFLNIHWQAILYRLTSQHALLFSSESVSSFILCSRNAQLQLNAGIQKVIFFKKYIPYRLNFKKNIFHIPTLKLIWNLA